MLCGPVCFPLCCLVSHICPGIDFVQKNSIGPMLFPTNIRVVIGASGPMELWENGRLPTVIGQCAAGSAVYYARCASTHLRALTKASIQGVTSSVRTRSVG